jgi:hypothetical protein
MLFLMNNCFLLPLSPTQLPHMTFSHLNHFTLPYGVNFPQPSPLQHPLHHLPPLCLPNSPQILSIPSLATPLLQTSYLRLKNLKQPPMLLTSTQPNRLLATTHSLLLTDIKPTPPYLRPNLHSLLIRRPTNHYPFPGDGQHLFPPLQPPPELSRPGACPNSTPI